MNRREDEYTWSDAYLDNKQVFVVRDDSELIRKRSGRKVVDVRQILPHRQRLMTIRNWRQHSAILRLFQITIQAS